MSRYVGIDFGTTNSAIAIAEGDAPAELIGFPQPDGGLAETWRTVLYFEPGAGQPAVSAGSIAISRFLESGGDGRFIQSAKSHLSSRLFSKTAILNRNYALEDLVSTYLLQMRSATAIDLGHAAVVGRPVRYWGAESEEDDARAIARMKKGLEQAGFTKIYFENEPSAAAAKYGAGLASRELVLIADFGGGTSDFCLLRVTPDSSKPEILATGGIGIGGDTFDGCIVDSLVAPELGKGSNYSDAFGGLAEVPRSLFSSLRKWHHLAFLKSRKTMALLERVASGADEPERIERFIHLVQNDLGLPLHQAIEHTKISLSKLDSDTFDFHERPVEIRAALTRDEFTRWIGDDLDKIDEVVAEVLDNGGVQANEVHRVFTTGGSSFVPAVRERLERQFPGRLYGGQEMTTVALGLAERARQLFS